MLGRRGGDLKRASKYFAERVNPNVVIRKEEIIASNSLKEHYLTNCLSTWFLRAGTLSVKRSSTLAMPVCSKCLHLKGFLRISNILFAQIKAALEHKGHIYRDLSFKRRHAGCLLNKVIQNRLRKTFKWLADGRRLGEFPFPKLLWRK